MNSKFNPELVDKVKQYVDQQFDSVVIPSLMDFIRIPNLSRDYDPDFLKNGLLRKAADFLVNWIKQQNIKGLKVDLYEDSGRTPLIFIEVDATAETKETIFFYGHLDKQPYTSDWKEGLSPTEPVIKDDKLYGRGGVDDGYAIYNSVMTIKALQELRLSHPRCLIMIEGDEESSGGIDLAYYFEKLKERIGTPAVFVCMDTDCGNYEQLWITTTLRGMLSVDVNVKIIKEGVHSGDASGIVPDTFRIIRQLLARLEEVQTGRVIKELHVDIPKERYAEAQHTANALKDQIVASYPFIKSGRPVSDDFLELYLNKVWRPAMIVIGITGLPPVHSAGNVLRPETSIRISTRLPPTLDSKKAADVVKGLLTENPPYGAEVTIIRTQSTDGWNAPPSKKFTDDLLNRSSKNFYGKEALSFGEGGTIPVVSMFGSWFPKTQFIVAGGAGPRSNAHGPNEFLHIPFTKNLLCCLIQTVAELTSNLDKD